MVVLGAPRGVSRINRKHKNVTEARREKQAGHCERSEHGQPAFRDGPQCSRERGVPSGARFGVFWPIFMAFLDHFLPFLCVFFCIFLCFEGLFGHLVVFLVIFWPFIRDAR